MIKIGFFGGMANNMYVFAKAFDKFGFEVKYIKDYSDKYPFSQPFWEDIPIVLKHYQIEVYKNWSFSKWRCYEKKIDWNKPSWFYDITDQRDKKSNMQLIFQLFLKVIFLKNSRLIVHRIKSIKLMSKCDLLIVCGIEGTIIANLSNKPFIIWPHGGDLRFAAGQDFPTTINPYIWIKYRYHLRTLLEAYKKSLFVGTHGPVGLGWKLDPLLTIIGDDKIKLIPIPLKIKKIMSKQEKRNLLIKLLKDFQINYHSSKFIGFIPSRLDFSCKGQDRFLNALAKSPFKKNFHIYVSGWGTDIINAKNEFSLDNITFLPFSLSKPLLYDFFRCMDFVVDQFVIGMYGTSAVEAMSCGVPVIMWINKKLYIKQGWSSPPVINTKTEQDAINVIERISNNKINLPKCGLKAQSWIKNVHGEKNVCRNFLTELNKSIKNK